MVLEEYSSSCGKPLHAHLASTASTLKGDDDDDDETWKAGYLADSEGRRRYAAGVPPGKTANTADRTLRSSRRGMVTNQNSIHYQRRRRKRKRHCCRWIQRVYSDTPHKLHSVSEVIDFDDISSVRGSFTPERSCIGGVPLPMLPSSSIFKHVGEHRLSCMARQTVSKGERSQDKDEYFALMKVMSALMDDYHTIQAQYQSYAPQSAIDTA